MSTLLKKFLLSILGFLIVFFSFAPFLTANAAPSSSASSPTSSTPTEGATWYNTSFSDWYNKVYDPSNPSEIFGERYTAAQVEWVIFSLFSFMINTTTGPQNTSLIQCVMSNAGSSTSMQSCLTAASGLFKKTSAQTYAQPKENLWAEVFATDRPISAISYVKDKVQNFNLVPVARAQTVGFGFTALNPIQKLWSSMRDIAFGLFVIAAVVLAFMIMFRVKISPQVVITVQSALPKLIVALILVTFSYAIAGFLIDLMYVVIGIISVAFAPFMGIVGSNSVQVFDILTKGTPNLMGNVNMNLGIIFIGALYLIAFTVGFIILFIFNIGLVWTAAIGAIAIPLFSSPLGPLLGIIGVLLLIALIIMILWFFIKTLFNLLKAFAQILLLTIFAPLQIVAGVVVPSLGFGNWIKSFVSNLAVFVVTGVLLLFSLIFLGLGYNYGFESFASNLGPTILQIFLGGNVAGAALPSQLGSANWPPLLGGGSNGLGIGLLFMGVSFVMFSLIPKANDIVQSIITGKPFAGSAIGEAQQAVGFISGAASTYAARQRQRAIGRGATPQEIARYQTIERGADLLQSLTKPGH